MQAELKVVGGKQQGKVIPLTMKKFLVGREKDCHLRPNNDLISRHHCVITVDEFSVRVRDLGSTNGTFVNSERVQGQVVLNHGDQLSFGKLNFELAIRESQAPAEVEAAPPVDLQDTESFVDQLTPVPENINSDSTVDNIGAAASAQETETIVIPEPEQPNGSGVYSGDTVMVPPQQTAMEIPMQPPAPQPMQGYPQYQFPGQPYMQPGMPMMPQQMMPQFMHPSMQMMPQQVHLAPQGMPPTGMPPQQPMPEPVQEEAPESAPSSTNVQDVRLPRPEETGATEGPAKTGSTGSGGDGVDPRSAAADIIRQYTQRAPGQ